MYNKIKIIKETLLRVNMEIPLLIAIIVLIMLSAFFSATETAFSSLNKIKMKNAAADGDKRAAKVMKLEGNFDRFISTILIGNNIVNITATTLATILFGMLIKNSSVANTVSTVVMTIGVLIFGEISPKTIAKKSPEYFALATVSLVQVICYILFPLTWLFGMWQKLINKIFKKKSNENITDDELITIVDEAQTGGNIDEYEGELIRSAIEFDDLTVVDILTPRVDVKAVKQGTDMHTVIRIFKETGFSRLPVYKDTIDNIVGVLNEKDFYNAYFSGAKSINAVVSSNIIYATPFEKISILLRKLQKAKTHIAIVVDEFGGTLGIVTLEDILEELVGDIWDEHDRVVESFRKVEENKYIVAGDVNLIDFFDYFEIKDDAEEYDATVLSGFVVMKLGQVPQVGDSIEFENLTITVKKTEHMKISECEVVVSPREEKEDEE